MRGVVRRLSAIYRNRTSRFAGADWSLDIDGALGEAVYAKEFNCYPTHAAPDYSGDNASGIEIRTTTRTNGRLFVHDNDHDDRPYVLITGVCPHYSIRGWLLGREAKDPRFWDSSLPNPCYAIAQSDLRDPELLRTACYRAS